MIEPKADEINIRERIKGVIPPGTDIGLVDLLERSGERLVELSRTGVDRTEKSKGHLATRADTEIEKILFEGLRDLYPRMGVFSEESGTMAHGKERWIVDPLDGTTNFVFGVPHFGISLAIESDGNVVEAFVFCPTTRELFHAHRDVPGAFLNGTRIEVSKTRELGEALVALGFSANYENISRYRREWPALFTDTRKSLGGLSPALNLCNLARGYIDAFVDFGASMEGQAGGAFIAKRAGASIANYDVTQWDHRVTGVMATNALLPIG